MLERSLNTFARARTTRRSNCSVGIDPDCRDRFDNTPLIVACQNGAGRIAKLCLRHGADVNAVSRKRQLRPHFCGAGVHAMAHLDLRVLRATEMLAERRGAAYGGHR